MQFISPSKGPVLLEEMVDDLVQYMMQNPLESYRLVVGTDSQPGKKTCFVSAVIIRREGKGARYYYRRTLHRPFFSLQQRIFAEATQSLEIAACLMERFCSEHPEVVIEIHLDIGRKGKTKDLINQVVSLVNTSGFLARIKPYAYGASKVADKFTK